MPLTGASLGSSVTPSISERSRDRVQSAIDRLEASYGTFPVNTDDLTVGTDRYRAARDRFTTGSVGYAGAWLVNDVGEVLLVSDVGRDGWSEPAGAHEPGETLEETAIREVREETGIECRLTGVALGHVIRLVEEDVADSPPLSQLVVAFNGEPVRGRVRPVDDAIEDARWWASHPNSIVYEGLRDLEIPAGDG